ncbi:protein BREAST CANCER SUSCEPTIBILITY 1 homolog [Pistacia vera]|uniref:protein BREAST CANCER SUSCEPTIBILITY 1 homolog n=1 Tax=Pistacia vera TaxID=55513 RepID=UPI001263C79F|nr:protein BREAST CANCER SUSCEPTIBILITY 1 homolog [Pistacia vera]
MEDPRTQLEKMGRELKCPICLSLLNSSVSLTCNHVFCNSCIMKSMKSDSNCPVCKVPYSRREVRAAPHMDNLVGIYKSMEIASGVSIFVTQNELSIKSSDKEKGVEGDRICSELAASMICQDRADNQETSKRKGLRRKTKTNLDHSGLGTVKPSFPTKKRVQVAKYPLPETPKQPAKFENELVNNSSIQLKDSSVDLKEKSFLNEKGPVLQPFFWLREEEDEEKSTQNTDGDAYLTPPEIPSFSDIMDSYDQSSQLSPTAETHHRTGDLDYFDSEMFEWTQRPCSPELLPSPVKTQVVHADENDHIKEKKIGTASHVGNTNEQQSIENAKVNSEKEDGIIDEGFPKSSPRSIDINNQIGNGKLGKRGMKAKNIARAKRSKRDKVQGSEIQADLREESVNVAHQINDCTGSSSVLKARKRREKLGLGNCATVPEDQDVLVPVRAENPNQGRKNRVSDLPASFDKKQGSDEEFNLEKTRTTSRKINGRNCLRSKRQNMGPAEVSVLKKVSAVQSQTNEDTVLKSSFKSFCLVDGKEASDPKEKASKKARKLNSALNSKCSTETKCKKRMKVSFTAILKDGLVDSNQEGHSNDSAKGVPSTEIVKGESDFRVLDESSRMKKVLDKNGMALRKCETLTSKTQCCFCHSLQDTEATGEMVHYYDGRPVAADYNGGSEVIHSHRNCTEWAPNVYFEDDTAINLEAELARSRRIKCCCCGLKGAALGCYEKSCRKSFHVPCAKLISQCRWDTDNFVMLCPLHASYKLPNENSGPQESRKKCISKRQLHSQCNQVAIKNDTNTSYNWKSSQNKLVLCCSALTVGEREIVSEFERLSKVTVLKSWDSSVTHVIASTDENGAGRRTLKLLMGILEGKWILNIEWVKACMKAMKPVDEGQYEIAIDTHGIRGGPRSGRQRVKNKLPKLFDGLKFYLMGGFVSSYKGYLQDLIIAAGGTILHRKPISRDQELLFDSSPSTTTFIIYSLELPDKCDLSKKTMILNGRQSEADVLANSTGAKAVSNSWVLNSIAACKFQSYEQ